MNEVPATRADQILRVPVPTSGQDEVRDGTVHPAASGTLCGYHDALLNARTLSTNLCQSESLGAALEGM